MKTDVTDQFLKDVATHQVQVLRDDGVYRHVRFARPGTRCMSFDLVTWPGYLAYSGDMGDFMFTRLHDMFEFFRQKPGNLFGEVDRRYWAEKCVSHDRSGITEYTPDLFKANIARWVDEYIENNIDDVDADLLRAEVDGDVLYHCDEEQAAHAAARDFEFNGRAVFQDFWEVNCREFTLRFTWCCHALAWGIAQYDALTTEVPA